VKLQSLRSSRLGAGAAAAALIGAAMLVPASTAHASGSPQIGAFDCNSWGAGQFFCSISIGGGTSPYTSFWQAGANVSGFYGQGTSYVLGYCVQQGQYASVSVIVTDDVGAQGTASSGFTCE
jgi:hypothetical protein